MTASELELLGTNIDDSFFIIGVAVLSFELIKGVRNKTIGKRSLLDMFASVSTQLAYIIVEIFVLSFAYLGYVYLSNTYVSWSFPINVWTIIAAVLACDFVYYWEHRFSHQIRLLWTQHAVHHSSRFMNITVATRFGPFEGLFSTLAHLPLVFVGFPPELLFFGVVVVLAYQTWIHTESIERLGALDGWLNTPSNHRVHHGCNEKYLDKNYGGIFIFWDRLFGTYQREEETPRYGLKRDFHSVNPFVVWFSELPGLAGDLVRSRSLYEVWMRLFAHPAWQPPQKPLRANAGADGSSLKPSLIAPTLKGR